MVETYKDAIIRQFDLELENIDKDKEYYYWKQIRYRIYAQICRISAVTLFSIGTIAPLVVQLGLESIFSFQVLAIGYLSLALAAIFLLIDRVGLFTEHHISKSTILISLDWFRQRTQLEKEATLPAMQDENMAAELLPAVSKAIRDFASERAALIRRETESWADARRKAQEDFSQELTKARDEARSQIDTLRNEQLTTSKAKAPGGLVISPKYPADFNGKVAVGIVVDGKEIEKKEFEVPSKRIAFSRLPKGIAEIIVRLQGSVAFEGLVEIVPGKIAEVECDMA